MCVYENNIFVVNNNIFLHLFWGTVHLEITGWLEMTDCKCANFGALQYIHTGLPCKLSDRKESTTVNVKPDWCFVISNNLICKICISSQVFKNLKLFLENKEPGDDLFDRLNVSVL